MKRRSEVLRMGFGGESRRKTGSSHGQATLPHTHKPAINRPSSILNTEDSTHPKGDSTKGPTDTKDDTFNIMADHIAPAEVYGM